MDTAGRLLSRSVPVCLSVCLSLSLSLRTHSCTHTHTHTHTHTYTHTRAHIYTSHIYTHTHTSTEVRRWSRTLLLKPCSATFIVTKNSQREFFFLLRNQTVKLYIHISTCQRPCDADAKWLVVAFSFAYICSKSSCIGCFHVVSFCSKGVALFWSFADESVGTTSQYLVSIVLA